MEDEGVVLHGLLLWAGGRGLGVSDWAMNGEDGEERESCQPACVAKKANRSSEWRSHAPNLAKRGRALLVKSRQIAGSGGAEEFFGSLSGEKAEIANHVGLVEV